MKLPAILLVLLALAATPFAQDQPDKAALREKAQKLADGLNYQKGEITLKGGLAKIRVPEEFRYLDSKDANTVLSRLWGNPPDSNTLGLIVPAKISPASPEAWAVIITYDEDGYVKDDEA